jgi:hypothetical protein
LGFPVEVFDVVVVVVVVVVSVQTATTNAAVGMGGNNGQSGFRGNGEEMRVGEKEELPYRSVKYGSVTDDFPGTLLWDKGEGVGLRSKQVCRGFLVGVVVVVVVVVTVVRDKSVSGDEPLSRCVYYVSIQLVTVEKSGTAIRSDGNAGSVVRDCDGTYGVFIKATHGQGSRGPRVGILGVARCDER